MSFLTPLFLAAASAALIPVLLHVVRRMKAREVPFSSLMFLTATPLERVRRRKVQDLLLLALRMLMLMLLAAAYARPYIVREHLPFLAAPDDESVVILVDLSMSMQADGSFEEALQQARDAIIAAGPGDELALVGFSDSPIQQVPLTRDRSLMEAGLASLAPGGRTTDLFPALQLAREILTDARHSAQRVVLVSDMQRSGFGAALEENSLPDGIVFDPVKVGTQPAKNGYFDDVKLTLQRPGDNTVARFDARFQAVSAGDGVTLVIEGQALDRKTVPAARMGPVTFQHFVPHTGTYRGHMELDADVLGIDNRYYFTYTVTERPSMLVVADDRDAFFLRHAFALGDPARFDYTRGQRLTGAALLGHDLVVVANRARLTAPEAAALQRFVRAGGSVVMAFGDAALAAGYGLETLGPGQLQSIVQAGPREVYIGQVEAQHPVFETLAGSSALMRPRFRAYAQVRPAAGSTVLGRYDTGDPFLIEQRMGKGTMLVYTSSLGSSWTDLPLQEIFVPFVYQLATYATNFNERVRQFVAGAPISLAGEPGATWDINAPTGSLHKVTIDSTGIGAFVATDQPGHYTAALGDDMWHFSVNTDPQESVLETYGEEEAYARVAGGRGERAVTPQDAVLSGEEAENEQKLWRLAILAVLGIFVLETFLAHRNRQEAIPYG